MGPKHSVAKKTLITNATVWFNQLVLGRYEYIHPMHVIMDDLKAFGINADQLTTSAQDEEEWFKTAELGAERSMTK